MILREFIAPLGDAAAAWPLAAGARAASDAGDRMSGFARSRHSATLFDHLVGTGEHNGRDFDPA
jgi:hypothetical protein